MSDLHHREQKIQNKRKQTPFRDFLQEIASWRPMTFYKNNGHISRYPVSSRVQNIISVKEFATLRDDIYKYGIDYSGDFFADITALWQSVPTAALNHFGNNENCDYSDVAYNGKNIYLGIVATRGVENAAYVFNCKDNSKNILSSINVLEWSENVYASSYIIQSYNVFFSENIINSNNMWLCTNCIWCSECVACDGLENMSYCIDNKVLDKDIYTQEKEKILQQKGKLTKRKSKIPINMGCSHVEWSNLYNCHDVTNAHFCINVNDARNVVFISSNENNGDFYDVFMGGRSTNFYGVCDAWGFSDNFYCVTQCAVSCYSMYYSMSCESCSFCLGCNGLINKHYCILNKQYSKEERLMLADKIFAQLEKDWTLWDFFPPSMNPFYFNDTAAYLMDQTFTKEEVTKLWYLRRDEHITTDIPDTADIVSVEELGQYESYKPSSWERGNQKSPSWQGGGTP